MLARCNRCGYGALTGLVFLRWRCDKFQAAQVHDEASGLLRAFQADRNTGTLARRDPADLDRLIVSPRAGGLQFRMDRLLADADGDFRAIAIVSQGIVQHDLVSAIRRNLRSPCHSGLFIAPPSDGARRAVQFRVIASHDGSLRGAEGHIHFLSRDLSLAGGFSGLRDFLQLPGRLADVELARHFFRILHQRLFQTARLICRHNHLHGIFCPRRNGRQAQRVPGEFRVLAHQFRRTGNHVVFDHLTGNIRCRLQLDLLRLSQDIGDFRECDRLRRTLVGFARQPDGAGKIHARVFAVAGVGNHQPSMSVFSGIVAPVAVKITRRSWPGWCGLTISRRISHPWACPPDVCLAVTRR